MKENKGLAIACCLPTASFFIVVYADRDDDSILSWLFFPIALISYAVLFGIAVFRIIKRSHLTWEKRLVPLYLLFLSFSFIVICSICINLVANRLDWLLVECYDFHSSDNILFRKDGEYQYWRGSPLGRSAIVRGRYERRDSLLIMQPNPDVYMPAIDRMAIRPYAPFMQRDIRFVHLVALDSSDTIQAVFHIKRRTE